MAGGIRRPADHIVLALRRQTASAADPHGHTLGHFSLPDQADPERSRLFGFSTGHELGGLPRDADEGIALLSDAEVGNDPALGDPDLDGPIYRLRFDHYLDRLARAKVNYIKILVFDEFKPLWSPFASGGRTSAPGGSTGVSQDYLDRLEELVRKARTRGVIICLSLFSSRMLRGEGWEVCPFNAKNNNSGDALGNGSFVVGDPLTQFCVIRQPPAGRRFSQMSVSERLYTVQRELVERLVDTTRRYWNVVYEICDDPRGPGEPGAMTEVVEWHAMVAGWLRELLSDHRGRRRRPVEVNAGPNLRAALLDAVGAGAGVETGALVDLIHLRGGEWGGYPGTSAAEACALRSDVEPGDELFDPDAIGGGVTFREAAWAGVGGAISALGGRPVAVVCDTDLHHLAQKLPQRYLSAVGDRAGHFVYRWTSTYLHRVDVARESCDKIGDLGQICPAKGKAGYGGCVSFGLEQRLELLTGAVATSFPLPPPPDRPALRAAAIDGSRIDLSFDPPPVEPDRYELFIGESEATAWAGTDEFPDPLVVERTETGYHVTLPPVARAESFWIALGAVRGILTSDLSDAMLVSVAPHGAELIAVDLPAEIETRRDYKGSVTFLNSGPRPWLAREEAPGMVTTIGLLFEAEGLSGGLTRLFIPMSAANLAGRADVVQSGENVKLELNEMQLDGAFAQTYGERTPVLLPYSRRPIRFRVGMAKRIERRAPDAAALEESQVTYERFGEARTTRLDDSPIQVTVREPRRLATRHVLEAQDLAQKAIILPLADGVDRSVHLVSLICQQGTPGTIVRSRVALERLVKEAGIPTRVALVEQEGEQAGDEPLHIEADVVRLHPIDIYYGVPAEAPRHRSHDLAAAGEDTAPFGGFAGRHTITIASSDTKLQGGETIHWRTLAEGPGGARLIVSGASREASRVVTFTAPLAEDQLGTDPRETSGVVTVPALGTVYVPLGAADAHRFLVARIVSDRQAAVTAELILRANSDGRFERALEVHSTDSALVSVVWRVLEVPVDAVTAHNRRPSEIHPIHAGRILEFFNDAEESRQFVDYVRDNRSYHRDTRRAYAIRAKLAQTILSARKKLGGAFTTLEQIDAISGIGEDTFEDIAFTFDDEGTPIGVG